MREDGAARSPAVLIDADNSSARYAKALFEEMVKLGEANVRRIHGDFSGGRLAGWDGAIQSLAILQHQQRGKNAADIALVIDAMDLMHEHPACPHGASPVMVVGGAGSLREPAPPAPFRPTPRSRRLGRAFVEFGRRANPRSPIDPAPPESGHDDGPRLGYLQARSGGNGQGIGACPTNSNGSFDPSGAACLQEGPAGGASALLEN